MARGSENIAATAASSDRCNLASNCNQESNWQLELGRRAREMVNDEDGKMPRSDLWRQVRRREKPATNGVTATHGDTGWLTLIRVTADCIGGLRGIIRAAAKGAPIEEWDDRGGTNQEWNTCLSE